MIDTLLNYDWSSFPSMLREILAEPTANLPAALLLLAMVSIALLILMISAVLIVMRPSGTSAETDEDAQGATSESEAVEEVPAEPEPVDPVRRRAGRVFGASFWVVGLLAVYIAAGVASSSDSLCLSCHKDNPHKSATADPHASVACVSCHESGSISGRFVTDVPGRVVHVVAGIGGSADGVSAAVSSGGCRSCHAAALDSTLLVKDRALKVSHTEPLAAGAECTDCHALTEGVVADHVAGMAPCIRCHDGEKASEKCGTCHIGETTRAVRSDRRLPTGGGRQLVSNPTCGGCHKDQSSCDSCHGIRLPHTQEFKNGGHAYDAALDLWRTDGKRCGKCHYTNHNDCGACHEQFLAHPPSWQQSHGRGISYASPCACHSGTSENPKRSFCKVCHDTRPAGSLP